MSYSKIFRGGTCAVIAALALSFLAVIFLGGCGKINDKLKNQDEIAKQVDIEQQNADLKRKSLALEADLAHQQLFYQGLAGRYQGEFKWSKSIVHLRLLFSPTVPPYISSRVRDPSEVAADLANLHFNVQVAQWIDGVPGGDALGCTFTNIKPDLHSGDIQLVDPTCGMAFDIMLSNLRSFSTRYGRKKQISTGITKLLLEKKISTVTALNVSLIAKSQANIYNFLARRAGQ